MSNESSASVPVSHWQGVPVNHQWSKGLDCEVLIATAVSVPYFSLLRSLHEVEICRRFAMLEDYFDTVTSCNRAYTGVGRAEGTRWCANCPKCRFVFLALAVFLEPDALLRIFEGRDLLADSGAAVEYRAVLGLGGNTPMECIGTTNESRWAMAQLGKHPQWRSRSVVRALAPECGSDDDWSPLDERGPHRVPPNWIEVLDALS
jgi:hypothetical protein